MVDLSASKTTMRTKKKARKYIDPDAFYLARRKAGLTMQQAALELDVDVRTIRNYENGKTKIPYPSFRILRLLANYQLIGKGWEDWSFGQNKLWSPEGRSFEVYELRYIATYISLARHFLKTKNQPREHAPSVRGEPSTLPPTSWVPPRVFGVEVRHASAVENSTVAGLQERVACA